MNKQTQNTQIKKPKKGFTVIDNVIAISVLTAILGGAGFSYYIFGLAEAHNYPYQAKDIPINNKEAAEYWLERARQCPTWDILQNETAYGEDHKVIRCRLNEQITIERHDFSGRITSSFKPFLEGYAKKLSITANTSKTKGFDAKHEIKALGIGDTSLWQFTTAERSGGLGDTFDKVWKFVDHQIIQTQEQGRLTQ